MVADIPSQRAARINGVAGVCWARRYSERLSVPSNSLNPVAQGRYPCRVETRRRRPLRADRVFAAAFGRRHEPAPRRPVRGSRVSSTLLPTAPCAPLLFRAVERQAWRFFILYFSGLSVVLALGAALGLGAATIVDAYGDDFGAAVLAKLAELERQLP